MPGYQPEQSDLRQDPECIGSANHANGVEVCVLIATANSKEDESAKSFFDQTHHPGPVIVPDGTLDVGAGRRPARRGSARRTRRGRPGCGVEYSNSTIGRWDSEPIVGRCCAQGILALRN